MAFANETNGEGNFKEGQGKREDSGRLRQIKVPGAPSLVLSDIICGTAQFGAEIPDERALALMDAYYRAGGRSLDTARVYGTWGADGTSTSERLVGEWLASRGVRGEMQIITKGAHQDINHMERMRVNVESIRADIEASLQTMGVDFIDLYMLHRDDPRVGTGEIIECLNEYIKAGRIGAIAVSNWSVPRIKEANAVAYGKGISPFTCSEISRSLAVLNPGGMGADVPNITAADMAFYQESGMPILAWGCLAGGYIIKAAQGREDEIRPGYRRMYQNPVTDYRVKNMQKVMAETGLSAEVLSIAYLTSHPITTAAIIGPAHERQMSAAMAAAGLVLPAEVVAELEYVPCDIMENYQCVSPYGWMNP